LKKTERKTDLKKPQALSISVPVEKVQQNFTVNVTNGWSVTYHSTKCKKCNKQYHPQGHFPFKKKMQQTSHPKIKATNFSLPK